MRASQRSTGTTKLLAKALRGDRRATSQLMSIAENDPQSRIEILAKLYWLSGKANIVGITGPPGCGKSTLISQLTKHFRKAGFSVGIVAVDPSSHITGGALLGDRIRMAELASDSRVFIRSMATRGQFGGIARATEDAVRILDATSMGYVIVETAGAGQSDVDVKGLTDTTVVVTAPGLGDEIQALKAGIMEIADIFVVNKADRENADQTARELQSMISMGEPPNGWRPRVIKTVAKTGEGVAALVEAINQHAQHIRKLGQVRGEDWERMRSEVLHATERYFDEITLQEIASSSQFEKILARVKAGKLDPYTAGRMLVENKKIS